MSDATVYIGIDTTAGIRPATIAVLDASMRILHLSSSTIDEIIKTIDRYAQSVCAVDAPIGQSRLLLSDKGYRKLLGLKPGKSYAGYRVCEFELRRRGVHIYKTPADRSSAASWMQQSWRLYDELRELGFVAFPDTGPRRMFETYPHAAFTGLIKKRPYPKNTFEGRMQRQLILQDIGVQVRDAMDVFEEMTRHRILTGELNYAGLYTDDELDALVAAYAACIFNLEPHNVTAVGDPSEGQILIPIPVQELKELYS